MIAALPLLFSSLLQAGNPKPDWISGESAKYPKAAYIVGVGSDATQDKAADRARAEVAKVFDLRVSETSSSSASERDGAGTQTVSDDVRTSTRKVLEGVEIAQYWDDGKGSVYALAVLDRTHALQVLSDKLSELDRSVPELTDRLAKSDGKFAKLKLALKLLRLSKSRRRLNADYRLLSPDGKGVPAPAALDGALNDARKAVSAVTIAVASTGMNPEQTASRISDGLSACGLKVVEKSATPADVVIEAKGTAQRLDPENITWFWAEGAMVVKMSYGASGEVFSRFEEKGAEASRDPETSVDAALAKLADQSADHAFKVITSNDILDD